MTREEAAARTEGIGRCMELVRENQMEDAYRVMRGVKVESRVRNEWDRVLREVEEKVYAEEVYREEIKKQREEFERKAGLKMEKERI